MIHHGDCLDVMAVMEPESVDAIVTDPPYGLEFMGKAWDHGVMGRPFADAMYRVAKPSSYLLAFGGTRTVHRMTVALEDAGWIIRDMLVWGYASGFPKSKASLKPAWEPIVMARKPGPLRMLAIDECRIPTDDDVQPFGTPTNSRGGILNGTTDARDPQRIAVAMDKVSTLGRWPANIVLTDPIFDGGIEGVVGGGEASYNPAGKFGDASSTHWLGARDDQRDIFGYGDTGTYSRFFLIPKAARSDREPVLGGHGIEPGERVLNSGSSGRTLVEGVWTETHSEPRKRANSHPTVKPTDLMRHLVRLVTPAGGTVLDPFLGSGTTGLAAEMEGFEWVGIEREAEYVAIAEARLNGTQRGLAL